MLNFLRCGEVFLGRDDVQLPPSSPLLPRLQPPHSPPSSPTTPPQREPPIPCSYQVAHRELLTEAEFYQLAGLCELLRGRLLELEDKGERLRRLSIDTAIADTRGGFDSLLSQIYAEMEGKAAQARAALQMGR